MSARVIKVTDKERVSDSLQNGEPVTFKDAVLQPLESQKRKKMLDSVGHLEVQLGRLAKMCRDIRAEIQSLTVEN